MCVYPWVVLFIFIPRFSPNCCHIEMGNHCTYICTYKCLYSFELIKRVRRIQTAPGGASAIQFRARNVPDFRKCPTSNRIPSRAWNYQFYIANEDIKEPASAVHVSPGSAFVRLLNEPGIDFELHCRSKWFKYRWLPMPIFQWRNMEYANANMYNDVLLILALLFGSNRSRQWYRLERVQFSYKQSGIGSYQTENGLR